MKRLIRYLLIGAAVVIGLVVAVLLVFREDLSQMAVRSTLEYTEEQVLQNLPAGESVPEVREDFERLLGRLQEGSLTTDDLKPLLDELATVYTDQQLTSEEVREILEQLREIIRR